MPEFFDSTHREESPYEVCPCVSKPGGVDSTDPSIEEQYWPVADRNELLRVLASKGVEVGLAERFLERVSHGDIYAIEDATWVSSPHHNRELVDHDGFTFRIEPSQQEGFDEQVTLRFRRGRVRTLVWFKVPSGIEDRMSWGAELNRALPSLTTLAEADEESPRDGRVGVDVSLGYVSFDGGDAVTIFGNGDVPTRRYGPYQSLADAALSATELARRAL